MSATDRVLSPRDTAPSALRRSGHEDSFCRDNLPPFDQWPVMLPPPAGIAYPDRLNAAAELLDTAIRTGRGSATALQGAGIRWTYSELADRVDRIAHVLREDFGLRTGARVLLRGGNHPMLAACWLAVLKAGCVAVTTMPLLRARELLVIAERARIDAALCEASLLEAWNEVRAARPESGPVLGYGPSDRDADIRSGTGSVNKADTPPRTEADTASGMAPGSLEHAMLRHDAPFRAADTAQDDVALIAFTSGTTGQPKGTMHFHRDLLLIADVLASHLLAPRPDDVFIGTPPLAFTFGLGGLLVFPLRAGACAVLQPQWTPESLLAGLAEHQATILFTAPTFYRKMAPLVQRESLRALRISVSSGEMLPADTREQWHEASGLEMTECLGSTELLHAFIGCRPGEVRPGATGRVVPGYQACILDEQGQPVEPGQIGRLAVRGPTGCRYLDDPRQQSYVQDGWNLTGDAYLCDADGYFWYQSRTDDMIISAGYNIAGPEVEDVLLMHPDVAECGVIGAPDTERGQVVMAFVVCRPPRQADDAFAQQLQQWVKDRLAPYKYPRRIRFVDALPRTENAKLQRFVLREWARSA